MWHILRPSSYGLGVMMFQRFWVKGWLTDWINEWQRCLYNSPSFNGSINHCEIAKSFPEYISSFVKVSCYPILYIFFYSEIEFCKNLNFKVWSKFEFLSLVTIRVIQFYHNLQFLSLVVFIILDFCRYLIFLFCWVKEVFRQNGIVMADIFCRGERGFPPNPYYQ